MNLGKDERKGRRGVMMVWAEKNALGRRDEEKKKRGDEECNEMTEKQYNEKVCNV